MAGDGRGKAPLSLVGRNADARFYAQQAWQRGGPVLVLGCASGRIALELCARSPRVVAVDPSAVMVRAAEERRHAEPRELSGRLRLLEADLRSLRLPDRFTVVLAPQNALGLMGSPEDLDALLATARYHLQVGGALLFDVLNPRGEPSSPDQWRPAFTPHLRERRRAPPEKELRAIHRLRLRQLHPQEVDAALARAGFSALERYGNFEGKPFDREDPLQVVVAGLA